MKIVSFDDYRIGVLNDDGVVDVTDVVSEVPDKLKWARMLVFIEEWASVEARNRHHEHGPHIQNFHANGLHNVEKREFAHILKRVV